MIEFIQTMSVIALLIFITAIYSSSYSDMIYKATAGKIKQLDELADKWKYLDDNVLKMIIDNWFEQYRPELDILTYGKTGVGKSSLINSLFERQLARECEYETCTHRTQKYSKVIDKVKINLWDMPGLYDATKKNDDTLRQLKKIKKVDVILVCINIAERRIRSDDIGAIKKLINSFEKSLLDHVILVFTFANTIDNKNKLNDLYFNKKAHIIKQIPALTKTPFVMGGYIDIESNSKAVVIHNIGGSHINDKILSNNINWFNELWVTIFETASVESQPALLKLNYDKLKSVESDPELEARVKKNIKEKGCFSINDEVKLRSGNNIKIKNLQVGDYVHSLNNEYTRVDYIYDHTEYYKTIVITTTNRNIELTPNHLISINGILVHAKYVKLNNVVIISTNKYITHEHVININTSTSKVRYIITDNNYIFVNNILCSAHSYSHTLGRFIGKVLKIYQLIKDMFYG